MKLSLTTLALTLTGLSTLFFATHAGAQLVATYQFNNTLAADQPGAPALTVINSGSFGTDTALGQSRTVYQRTATNSVAQSALRLDTTPLSLTANNYAVEMVFDFTNNFNPGDYRRIVDSNNATADPGFYLSPVNTLSIYQSGPHSGGSALSDGTYYDVVLNVSPTGEQAYLNGALAATFTGTPDSIATHFLNLFLDDGIEYGNGNIALLRVFNQPLTSGQVTTLYNNGNPFPASTPPNATPEPGSLALFGSLGLTGVAFLRRRISRRR